MVNAKLGNEIRKMLCLSCHKRGTKKKKKSEFPK